MFCLAVKEIYYKNNEIKLSENHNVTVTYLRRDR